MASWQHAFDILKVMQGCLPETRANVLTFSFGVLAFENGANKVSRQALQESLFILAACCLQDLKNAVGRKSVLISNDQQSA